MISPERSRSLARSPAGRLLGLSRRDRVQRPPLTPSRPRQTARGTVPTTHPVSVPLYWEKRDGGSALVARPARRDVALARLCVCAMNDQCRRRRVVPASDWPACLPRPSATKLVTHGVRTSAPPSSRDVADNDRPSSRPAGSGTATTQLDDAWPGWSRRLSV